MNNFPQSFSSVSDETELHTILNFLLSEEHKESRYNYYKQKVESGEASNLPEAKTNLLKEVFSEFISSSLQNANNLFFDSEEKKALHLIDRLQKLEPIFKEYDNFSFPEFISEVEKLISPKEAELLFIAPSLNGEELEKMSNAFVRAFRKKKKALNNINDFKKSFFNHPFISCLDAHKEYSKLASKVEKGEIETGVYGTLIKGIMKLRQRGAAEDFQSFLTFLIKEDITAGLTNIVNDPSYPHKEIQYLLNHIISGKEISNGLFKHAIDESRASIRENYSLDKGSLRDRISSQFALNDYGFHTTIAGTPLFFHGHTTENKGENQREQQGNTARILREQKDITTLGLTVTQHSVMKSDHHMDFIVEMGLSSYAKEMSEMDKVFLCGLQFDHTFTKHLASTLKKEKVRGDEAIASIQNSNLLNSNFYIVKSAIDESKAIINSILDKNDFDILLEKKEAYMQIMQKNESFFSKLLEYTPTQGYLSYQLLANPLVEYTESLLRIEKTTGINLLKEEDVRMLQRIMSTRSPNVDLESKMERCQDLLQERDGWKLQQVSNSHGDLKKMIQGSVSSRKNMSLFK